MTAPSGLLLRNIVKAYGGVVAVKGVTLSVAAGEVHAVVGENGAGKSTLMKILSGAIPKDEGSILVDGSEVEFRSPADALLAGVSMIPQELQLVREARLANFAFAYATLSEIAVRISRAQFPGFRRNCSSSPA